MESRTCRKCGQTYPLTTDFFGHQPNKSLRYSCRKCMAAHTAKHSAQHLGDTRLRAQIRANREAVAPGVRDESHVRRVRRRLGDRCLYCGSELHGGGHEDHMTPVARGGSNGAENITLACSKCNAEKHAKTADEYRQWRGDHGLPCWPGPDAGSQRELGFEL